jgi:drug/metabolite transporter (DMT)-like permease
MWPIMVVLLSIPLLQQRITSKHIGAILTSFFGVFIISTGGNFFGFKMENGIGVILALCSAIIWAVFWIYNIRDQRDVTPKLFLNFAFGFIVILAFTIGFSSLDIPEIEGIIGIIYVGIFEMGITFVIWLKALSLSKTTAQVSNLIYVSPFLSLVFISLFVGETILLSTFIGLIFIVAGLLYQHYISQDR